MTRETPARRSPVRLTAADLRGVAWALVSTTAGIGIAIVLIDGVSVSSFWAVPLVALAVGLGDAILRVPLRRLARWSGAVGALLLGLTAQVLVAGAAMTWLPGVTSRSWGDAVAVLVVAGLVMACGHWLVGASDNEYVVSDLVRRSRRRAGLPVSRGSGSGSGSGHGGREDGRDPGLLVVMLDGVSRSTLEHALEAGLAPTLGRWLGSGTHRLDSWWARVPCTTPASTLGLFHGTTDLVPAFRWWSRERGALVVTNRPRDAAEVERRASDGAGLLAGGGTAVSTMFSGDAATNLLVMSRASEGLGPGALFVRFFSSPFVLVRAVLGTFGETVKELYQGWQQAVRGVRPRVGRRGWYPVLRAVTNVLLRDLNTSLVAEQLVSGVPVVAVDLVDYDEIAHHAGPLRPESLRALEGLDRVLGLWEVVAAGSPRRYEVVVVSDHGQSLGATFEQVSGRSLADEVRRLVGDGDAGTEGPSSARTTARSDDAEAWGPANTALNALRHGGRHAGQDDVGRVLVGPDRERGHVRPHDRREAPEPPRQDDVGRTAGGQAAKAVRAAEVEVVGSGNLGMVWFCASAVPLDGAEVAVAWPRLVPGLLENPAVGVVVVRDGPGALAVGRGGSCDLASGEVTGVDPLDGYGMRAREDLLRVVLLEDAGDLVLVSSVGPLGRVHAFEGLVGSHGGLGGEQNEAFVLHPAHLEIPAEELEDVDGVPMLVGAENVHRRLVGWLVAMGLRDTTTKDTTTKDTTTKDPATTGTADEPGRAAGGARTENV